MPNTFLTKQDKPKVLTYFPTKAYGSDGDTVVVKIQGRGVFFCIKAGGLWYAQSGMQPLNKLDKTFIKHLKSERITLKNIRNADIDTNKFIVSDNGDIRFRTGDEILSDLGVDLKSVNYKSAYCSLGQYTDKESCQSNGGTWYYSENDSHDSISSTAENQLLTVGQSIGNLDAESTLTYDGSILEIKYNSDFDDNWQTSATTDLLKLSYDSDNYAKFTTSSAGLLTIATVGSGTKDSYLHLDVDGLITLDSASGYYYYYNDKDANPDDYFLIRVLASGSTKLKTNNNAGTAGDLTLEIDGDLIVEPATGVSRFQINSGNYCQLAVDSTGVTDITTVDADGTVGHLTLAPDGDLVLDPVSTKTIINATDGLYFDGGTHTYIYEAADDALRLVVGGDTIMQLSEYGDDGNEVHFGSSCVGFTQLEPTYDATNTDVDFRHSNKQFLTFGAGNITNLVLTFPLVSGNFVLLLKQGAGGSATITNYKAMEFDESAADGEAAVKFAGGSNPTLTTDANHVDILSFYWDADNEIAYGVATLDFQF